MAKASGQPAGWLEPMGFHAMFDFFGVQISLAEDLKKAKNMLNMTFFSNIHNIYVYILRYSVAFDEKFWNSFLEQDFDLTLGV